MDRAVSFALWEEVFSLGSCQGLAHGDPADHPVAWTWTKSNTTWVVVKSSSVGGGGLPQLTHETPLKPQSKIVRRSYFIFCKKKEKQKCYCLQNNGKLVMWSSDAALNDDLRNSSGLKTSAYLSLTKEYMRSLSSMHFFHSGLSPCRSR